MISCAVSPRKMFDWVKRASNVDVEDELQHATMVGSSGIGQPSSSTLQAARLRPHYTSYLIPHTLSWNLFGQCSFGVWSLESGVWSLECGVWSLESGVRSPESGVRSPESLLEFHFCSSLVKANWCWELGTLGAGSEWEVGRLGLGLGPFFSEFGFRAGGLSGNCVGQSTN